MSVEILTKEDLEDFRTKLLNELKFLLNKVDTPPAKKWLRSHEVRNMLNISPGTLQNLGINDILHPTKIGGINFYKYEEIEKIMGYK